MAYKKWTRSHDSLRPDTRYGNRVASKFINCMMRDGKKSIASKIFYDALTQIAKKVADVPPIEVFERALNNVKPNIQVRSRRVGGSNYQVPMPVNKRRQESLAIRWILEAALAKKGKPMRDRLASELLDAYRGEGAAMTTRENVHRMADANKAFAHFAW
ncbi:MAG: 30S ribosomal protein S7 [Phycisphaerae bacterium]|nr:30S ribosomal protein S7 [Phycisphaerae bacterium]